MLKDRHMESMEVYGMSECCYRRGSTFGGERGESGFIHRLIEYYCLKYSH